MPEGEKTPETNLMIMLTGWQLKDSARPRYGHSNPPPQGGGGRRSLTEGEDCDQPSDRSRRASAILMISRTTPSRLVSTSLAV